MWALVRMVLALRWGGSGSLEIRWTRVVPFLSLAVRVELDREFVVLRCAPRSLVWRMTLILVFRMGHLKSFSALRD